MPTEKLQENAERKIRELSNYAHNLPGVIIIHDLQGAVVWMSENGLAMLNSSLEQIRQLSADEYYSRFFNPEDAKDYVPKILSLLESNNDENMCTYFQQVRLSQTADWTWHMSSTKVFMRDDEGHPLYTITMAFPIDSMHHMVSKAERLLRENNFLRKHYHQFDRLSKREKEILRLFVLGKSSGEIADQLFISEHTVDTHKRNIKSKLKANSMFELGEYARAFDLI